MLIFRSNGKLENEIEIGRRNICNQKSEILKSVRTSYVGWNEYVVKSCVKFLSDRSGPKNVKMLSFRN